MGKEQLYMEARRMALCNSKKDDFENEEQFGYEAGHDDGFDAGVNWQKSQGNIQWYEIAKDGVPKKMPGDDITSNLILYSDTLDQFTRGAYIHAINRWTHNSGNWQPTHYAFINYPE